MRKTGMIGGIFLTLAAVLPGISGTLAEEPAAVVRPGLMFFASDTPKIEAKNVTAGTAFTVMDWKGGNVVSGKVGENGLVPVGKPGPGYYTVHFTGSTAEKFFSVIPNPEKRQVRPDSPFAADAAVSMMASVLDHAPGNPAAAYGYFADLCRNAGIDNVRERLSWAGTEASKGKFDAGKFGILGDVYTRRGIGVSATWHDVPGWCAGPGGLPENPFDLYHFAKRLASEFAGKIDTWEFWNEQDSSGFLKHADAWTFAAMAKAAYLGLKAGNPKCTVMSGGFCLSPGGFWLNLVQNGYTDYIDAFNYHVYDPIGSYRQVMDNLKQTLAAAGIPDMPIVITENSIRLYAAGHTEVRGVKKVVQTPQQEMLVAEANIKGQLLLHSFGADRVYTFVLPAYNEGDLDWGMVRYDGTAKPVLAAFANLTALLGDAEYRGEIALPEKEVRAFLYAKPDGSNVIVCWSESELEGTVPVARTVRFPAKKGAEFVDFFGKRSPASVSGEMAEVKTGRYPVYLLNAGTPHCRVAMRRTVAGSSLNAEDKTVVMQLIPSPDFTVASSRLALELKKDASDRSLTLRVCNFSPKAKTLRLSAAGRVSGLSGEIRLDPFGTAERKLELPASGAKFLSSFTIGGFVDGKRISPLAFSVMRHDAELPEGRTIAAAMNPENWTKKSSGTLNITYDARRKALRFECVFGPNCKDRWVYPAFDLKKAGVSAKNDIGMVFDMQTEQTRAEVPPVNNLVMLNGDYVYYKPSAGESVRNFIAFPSPDSLKTVSIGMNPTKDRIVWYLSRVRFVSKSEN